MAALAYGLLGLGLLGLIASTPFVLAAVAPANTDWGGSVISARHTGPCPSYSRPSLWPG